MNTLVAAVAATAAYDMNHALTENGADTLRSSGDAFTDLFAMIGSSRLNADNTVAQFVLCFSIDPAMAMRILFWARDARGGAGERAIFRRCLSAVAQRGQSKLFISMVDSGIVETIGRWDDYLELLMDTDVAEVVRNRIAIHLLRAVRGGNQLAAKWMPRKGLTAAELRCRWKLSPKLYRKLLVNATNVVETKMCAKQWEDINFQHVPSVAMARYSTAFSKNSIEAFPAYRAALTAGTAKVNAAVLYPYDVLRTVRAGDAVVAQAQWDALPDFVDNNKTFMPIIDVSGSMTVKVAGSTTAMDVAVSLGLYLAERSRSVFKDKFITFSTNPSFVDLAGVSSIAERIAKTEDANWGGSTDLQSVFDIILSLAVRNNVAPSDMPEFLFIVSDMEFDTATNTDEDYFRRSDQSGTNFEVMRQKFSDAGYPLPKVIFWNVAARGNNIQTTADENGTAMISGFSPSIIRPVLNSEAITPRMVMNIAVMNKRYDVEGVTV